MKTCAIYTITNLVNNKIYVGYTNDFNERKNNHLLELIGNRHKNIYLQKAFNKYKEENFTIEILEEVSEDLLIAMEHYWATILNTHNKNYGYNIAPTNPITKSNRPMLGKKHTDNSIAKISKSRKGKLAGKDNPFYGKKHSEESLKKMSISAKGRKISEKTKLKMSKIKKGKTPKNIEILKQWMKGKSHTKETKYKLSEIQKIKIYQFSKQDLFIKEWPSAKDACMVLKFKNPSELTRCARNSRGAKTAYGFKWKYKL